MYTYTWKSSARISRQHLAAIFWRALIQRIKRIGPKSDPWGTQLETIVPRKQKEYHKYYRRNIFSQGRPLPENILKYFLKSKIFSIFLIYVSKIRIKFNFLAIFSSLKFPLLNIQVRSGKIRQTEKGIDIRPFPVRQPKPQTSWFIICQSIFTVGSTQIIHPLLCDTC